MVIIQRIKIVVLVLIGLYNSINAQNIFPNVDGLPENNFFPDPFLMASGAKVRTYSQWREQRQYLLDEMLYYEYGKLPPAPGNVKGTVLSTTTSADGLSITKKMKINCGPNGAVEFNISLDMPKGTGPFPTFIVLGDADLSGIKRGYAMVSYDINSLSKDNIDTHLELPQYPDADWGTLAAWAWGVHRIVDLLETFPEVDRSKIAVTGHSRLGKATLLAGALDERIAIVIPVQSGTGGSASGKFGDGETVEAISTHFKFWFQRDGRYVQCGKPQNKLRMPFDQHFLKVAVAPRRLLVLEGAKDQYSSPMGSSQTNFAAQPVYDFLGASGNLGIHYCDCVHDMVVNWPFIMAYTDSIWFGKSLPKGYFDMNKNYPKNAALIPWSTPTTVSINRTLPWSIETAGGVSIWNFRIDGRRKWPN
jgi:hypothetical protein